MSGFLRCHRATFWSHYHWRGAYQLRTKGVGIFYAVIALPLGRTPIDGARTSFAQKVSGFSTLSSRYLLVALPLTGCVPATHKRCRDFLRCHRATSWSHSQRCRDFLRCHRATSWSYYHWRGAYQLRTKGVRIFYAVIALPLGRTPFDGVRTSFVRKVSGFSTLSSRYLLAALPLTGCVPASHERCRDCLRATPWSHSHWRGAYQLRTKGVVIFYAVIWLHLGRTPIDGARTSFAQKVSGCSTLSSRYLLVHYHWRGAYQLRTNGVGIFYAVIGLPLGRTPIDGARTCFAQKVSGFSTMSSRLTGRVPASHKRCRDFLRCHRATCWSHSHWRGAYQLRTKGVGIISAVIGLPLGRTPIDGARTSFAQKVSGFSTLSSGYLLVALPLTGRVPASHKRCRDFLRCRRATSWSHSHWRGFARKVSGFSTMSSRYLLVALPLTVRVPASHERCRDFLRCHRATTWTHYHWRGAYQLRTKGVGIFYAVIALPLGRTPIDGVRKSFARKVSGFSTQSSCYIMVALPLTVRVPASHERCRDFLRCRRATTWTHYHWRGAYQLRTKGVGIFYTVIGLHLGRTSIDGSFAQKVSGFSTLPSRYHCRGAYQFHTKGVGIFYAVIALPLGLTTIDGARTSFAQKVSGFSTLSSGYLLVALPLTGRVPASHKRCRDFLRCHRATSWSHSHWRGAYKLRTKGVGIFYAVIELPLAHWRGAYLLRTKGVWIFYAVIGLPLGRTPIDGARTSFAQKVSGFSMLSSGYLLVALPLTVRVPASHKRCRDFLRCHRAIYLFPLTGRLHFEKGLGRCRMNAASGCGSYCQVIAPSLHITQYYIVHVAIRHHQVSLILHLTRPLCLYVHVTIWWS